MLEHVGLRLLFYTAKSDTSIWPANSLAIEILGGGNHA